MDMFGGVGPALKLLREQAGMSQADLARKARMGKSQLSKYESRKELPKLDSLARILGVLKVQPLWLFYIAHLLARPVPEESLPTCTLLEAGAPGMLIDESEDAGFRDLFDQVLSLYRKTLESRVLRAVREG